MSWQVREAGPQDAGAILPLLAQVHALHVAERPHAYVADPDPEAVEAWLRGWLSDTDVTALLAEAEDGAAAGYLIFTVQRRPASVLRPARVRCMLEHVGVDAPLRRRGVGAALIADMRRRARAAGADHVATIHAQFNEASAALMASAGLTPAYALREGPV